jgi:hypothetical protein
MDFEVISAERGRTQVDVVPSSPDGYFHIGDDPFFPPHAVSSIALRGIKPRHIKALKGGDTAALDRYIVTDPDRPGFVSFTKCDPAIPDPLEPAAGTVYVRGAQEVNLDRSNRVDDAHRAIGEWWAQRLLNPIMDIGEREIIRPNISESDRERLAQRAGDFALILADLSRTRGAISIHMDYHPDSILRDAADRAFVNPVLSFKSHTHLTQDGIVMAKEGRSGEQVQIWPPISKPTSA